MPHVAFGMQVNIIVSNPLPVKFGNVFVNSSSTKALLKWDIFSEMNTGYFYIRKSTDATHFYEIGRNNAAGNPNISVTYQFADDNLGKIYKYLYYEIVTVDADKRESFSVIRLVRNNNVLKDILIVALSSNPIPRPGQVQLKFNADKTGEMDALVYNNTEQLVLKTKLPDFYCLNSVHLHVCDLGKGTYYIIFNLAGTKKIKKVMVL